MEHREKEKESESETEKRKSSNVSCRRLKGYGKGGSERAKRERASERAAKTRACHTSSCKQAWKNAPEKSIRCSEGGGRRGSVERTSRQSWMHYLPPGVFYDFLGSHNKVRQRVSHNGSSQSPRPPSFFSDLSRFPRRGRLPVFIPLFPPSPFGIVFARRSCRPGKYASGRHEILYADYPQ